MKRAKARKKPRHQSVAQLVATMAARGLVEDEIAAYLSIDKNELRAKYIADIKRGKAKAAASEAQTAHLSRAEMHAANAILLCFDGPDWIDNGRSLLFCGLDGGGAKNPGDAFAAWMATGSHFICTGRKFSRERLREFSAVKAAAQELLKSRR